MKKTRFTLFALALIAAVLLLGGHPPTAHAAPMATFIVTKTADTNDGACDADCSLREALAAAASASGADTITFDASLSGGTITLALGQLSIDHEVTIDGSALAVPITVSGNNATRVFNVTSAGNATLDSLTVAHGNSGAFGGGGIRNEGTLTVANSTFNSNTTSDSGGGGIASVGGTLTVTNSTFSGNTANSGGAIRTVSAIVTVTNSTFSGNTTTFAGAGYYASGGTATLTNVTISGNTVSNNTALWVDSNGTLNLNNSIVANTTGGSGDCGKGVGTVNAQNSLIESGLGCVNGTNSANLTGDPTLGALANNGGPTLTHMPRIDSPAVDAGNCASGPMTDQRGESRPQDATCDIGAVEVQSGEDEIEVCGLVAGGVYHFGATGVQIEIDTLGTLQCLDVAITNAAHPTATLGIPAPYVAITTTPAIASGFQVTMTLLHAGLSNPQICKYPGGNGGAGWDCARDGFDSNRVWRGSINGFSDWAVGNNVGPTAVTLNSLITTNSSATLPWLTLIVALILLTVTAVWRAQRPA